MFTLPRPRVHANRRTHFSHYSRGSLMHDTPLHVVPQHEEWSLQDYM